MSLCAERSAHEKRASDCPVPSQRVHFVQCFSGCSINEHSSCTSKNAPLHALLKFLRNGLVQSEFFIDLQLDDSDDLPNL
jgi:hypothetical protein